MEEKFNHAVLVVDKDENLTGWIEKTLAKIGVTVVSAPTGELGIEKIKAVVAIFRYLLKPLETDQFFSAVRSGLSQYEVGLENVRLLALAKEQNAKLYMYNCDLKERAESHQKTLEQLDRNIRKIIQSLEQAEGETSIPMSVLAIVRENKLLTRGKMVDFYTNLMGQLFIKFQSIAEKNGFSMPETIDTPDH